MTLSREGQQLHAQLIALAHGRKFPLIEQPLIRLAVAESIFHDILGRYLISLLRRNACVRLEIISLDSVLSLQSISADVVLWLSEPDSPLPGPSFATNEPICLALAIAECTKVGSQRALFFLRQIAQETRTPRRVFVSDRISFTYRQ